MDSHAHLSMLARDPADALRRADEAGVTTVVCVGTDAPSSADAVAIAVAHAEVRATVGLHPHDATRLDDEWSRLVGLADAPEVAAIGETGLDFHYRHSPEEDQERAFRRQIELAKARGLALVVHSREAWDDTFRILEDEGMPERTVLHCFTGGPVEARRALDLGAWLSFSGIVSFRNADDVRAAAALTPGERLLVETDAPYLAPVPHRGAENEPALVPIVGAAVAAARGVEPEAVAEATSAAAARVFGTPAGR
ncbi:MAG TPA: TatD family hydrolase [Acidimicrobiia bacterium]|nr:TatD family hydrolase [Acidimicrobiia bacterium]